jgi:adenylate cyclase
VSVLDTAIAAPAGRHPAPRRSAAGPIIDWLVRDARFLPDNAQVFAETCKRIAAAGVPLARGALHLRALHPQFGGVSRIWTRGGGLVQSYLHHGIEKTAHYLNSPVRAVVDERRSLGWRLDPGIDLPYPVLAEFREQGLTHYLIRPLVYADGAVNAVGWATDRPGGFAAADLRLLDGILPAFANIVELKALRRFSSTLVTTYVGREPGRLILDGQIRRGDVRTITAALMLVDLRDFTLMSDRMNPQAVVRLLNQYFDCVMPPIRRGGGEVMEIMGDGVLAIFNQNDGADAGTACRAALDAASKGLAAIAALNGRRRSAAIPALNAGCALHYGTVSYGNIGAEDRLDFTVIGPDVNLTSRIERLCRELDRDLIMSAQFAETLGRPVFEIGHFELRGFTRMQRLYELPPSERK